MLLARAQSASERSNGCVTSALSSPADCLAVIRLPRGLCLVAIARSRLRLWRVADGAQPNGGAPVRLRDLVKSDSNDNVVP